MENKATLFRMSAELKEFSEKIARKRGIKLSELIRMLLLQEIERDKENEKNIAKSIDKCISNDI